MDIQNKKLPDSEFHALRAEVLLQWPTGKDVDLDEAVAYHKNMAENRIFSKKLLTAKKNRQTLVQPRAGVPVVDSHIELLRHLQDKGEADLLPRPLTAIPARIAIKKPKTASMNPCVWIAPCSTDSQL